MSRAEIRSDVLNLMFKQVECAVKPESGGGENTWVKFEFDKEIKRCTAIAVDGYRLHVEQQPLIDCDDNFFVYIPPKTRFPKNKIVKIYKYSETPNLIRVECGEFSLTLSQFSQFSNSTEFDWKKVIPQGTPTSIAFNPKYMYDALKSFLSAYGKRRPARIPPVVLDIYGDLQPMLLHPKNDKSCFKMVLPVRNIPNR